MNYIAIDTASQSLKILLSYKGEYSYYQCDDFKAASVSLMPELDKLLVGAGAKPSDMDFYACVIGPGSFTGIRIGMATVKAFAYACGLPVMPVTALELLAYNNREAETAVAVCDASNGLRYAAVYDDGMRELMSPRCLNADELREFLAVIDEPYAVYADSRTAGEIERAVCPTDYRDAFIRAVESNISRLQSGNELQPLYIRKPQAECDLERKNGAQS